MPARRESPPAHHRADTVVLAQVGLLVSVV